LTAPRDLTRRILERLGPHPTAVLGIDLAEDEALGPWLVAACLLAGRARETVACEAYRALARARLASPAEIAKADPPALHRTLAGAGYPKPESAALKLVRAAAALEARYGGSVAALASDAEGIEDLSCRIAQLAPGIGAATVARFLRPLRERWPAAREVPLAPAARAAALHLGLLREGEDEEGEPGALRSALLRWADAPALADVEAALARLGERACLRGRSDRCPLGADCPAKP
jgi:endonuclease III